jgi:preprotein translocase subunit SecG
MQLILTVLHLMLAIGLIGLILIQHGRGADAGAAFGSGASSTVFGAQGSGSFLSRSTAIIATLFFLTSMALAYFAAQVGEPKGLMDDVEVPAPVVIDTSDVPSTDLPPGAASNLSPSDQATAGMDVPVVDAPADAVPNAAPGTAPINAVPVDASSAGQSASESPVDDAPPAAPDASSADEQPDNN